MSRPITEAKYNLAQKEKYHDFVDEQLDNMMDQVKRTTDHSPAKVQERKWRVYDAIRTYVLNEAKAHLHNNPDCSCRENSEENIDNLL